MNTGKIVRNAGSHRILHALSFGSKSGKELKHTVGSINSVARFEGEYMSRLVTGGYVRRDVQGWSITKRGQEMLESLGPVSGMPRKAHREPMAHLPVYVPAQTHKTPMRPGSEDFLKYPSRMANKLFYRDGTVKDINDGH